MTDPTPTERVVEAAEIVGENVIVFDGKTGIRDGVTEAVELIEAYARLGAKAAERQWVCLVREDWAPTPDCRCQNCWFATEAERVNAK